MSNLFDQSKFLEKKYLKVAQFFAESARGIFLIRPDSYLYDLFSYSYSDVHDWHFFSLLVSVLRCMGLNGEEKLVFHTLDNSIVVSPLLNKCHCNTSVMACVNP